MALTMLAIAGASAGMAQQGTKPMGGVERLTAGVWLAEDIGGGGVIDTAQSTFAITADGAVSGSGGCNRLTGRARIDGQAVGIGPLATTRKACVPALMDQERKFLAALEATRAYRFDGAVLRFLDASGAELVRFTKLR
jgi:putative lipoprotein